MKQKTIYKKIIPLIILCLCSCKSITYQDVNPAIVPNSNLLPALEPVVSLNNLEATYTAGTYSGYANNFGSGYGQNNWAGWLQTTAIEGIYHKDIRVYDVINIFQKEVKENITSPYGEKKGYITLKLGYRENNNSLFYVTTSTLTLYTMNFLGYPFNKISQSLEIEVEIWNKKKELIKRYVENSTDECYIAMYWGYSASAHRKVAADNIRHALEKIRLRINSDAKEIKTKLK